MFLTSISGTPTALQRRSPSTRFNVRSIVHRNCAPRSQIEMFKTIERWIEFARDEINEWPATQSLGMTPRTEALTRALAQDRSPLSR